MKLRLVFLINVFFAAIFGLACTFFPRFVFQLYGTVPEEGAIWVAQLVGGALLGYGTLMWYGWKTAHSSTRRAIAVALLIQDSIGCAASIIYQLTGKVNAFGWSSIGLYGLLACIYAYFLFLQAGEC